LWLPFSVLRFRTKILWRTILDASIPHGGDFFVHVTVRIKSSPKKQTGGIRFFSEKVIYANTKEPQSPDCLPTNATAREKLFALPSRILGDGNRQRTYSAKVTAM
jgi:hypothetical protein